jgi:hypothetical protein
LLAIGSTLPTSTGISLVKIAHAKAGSIASLIRRVARRERGCERAVQARHVGRDAREKPKRFDGLTHAHAAAIHHAAAFRGGGLKERSLDRRIDDIGAPMRGVSSKAWRQPRLSKL